MHQAVLLRASLSFWKLSLSTLTRLPEHPGDEAWYPQGYL